MQNDKKVFCDVGVAEKEFSGFVLQTRVKEKRK